jgi:heptosyltransferase-3
VNSYSLPVLADNPDLDNVYAYTRTKHRGPRRTLLGVHWQRLKLMLALRRQRYDVVILANGGYLPRPLHLARWVAPRAVVGFVPPSAVRTGISFGVSLDDRSRHEVEDIFRLLQPLGIDGPPPPLRLVPTPQAVSKARDRLTREPWYDAARPLVAIHISSRKVSQRWPPANFVALMEQLEVTHGVQFMLFWSPGEEDNPMHPGDCRKAAAIMAACARLRVLAYPTSRLDDLVGGLSLCSAMVCSDGGAMHVGAGLGLPMVCFFGDSDAARWHPWGVRHELLQKASRHVGHISVAEAWEAFNCLTRAHTRCAAPSFGPS